MHLYIHIPFCRYRCDYCDFFTRTCVSGTRQKEVLRAIAAQAGELLQRFSPGTPETVYVGGGTPSALAPEARDVLLALLGTLTGSGGAVREVTVELNPEDVTESLLDSLEASGVNRLSLGVQSLRDETLARIGRPATAGVTRRGLELVARRWGGAPSGRYRWSADLLAGIPGGTPESTVRDLEEILTYAPEHISLYELGIERDTALGLALRRGRIASPPVDTVAEELEWVRNTLIGRGYIHYEVSNYALPGGRSVHNLGYWRMAPHLGIGPGAVGTLTGEEPVRYTNTRDFSLYCTAGDRGLREEGIAPRDFVKELLMMGLRTEEGVSLSRAAAYLGVDPAELIPETLARWNVLPGSAPDRRIVLSSDIRNILDSFLLHAFAEIDRLTPPQS